MFNLLGNNKEKKMAEVVLFDSARSARWISTSFLTGVLLAHAMAPASYGADCDGLVSDRIRWVAEGGGNWVRLVMATHETGRSQLVSYTDGTIDQGHSNIQSGSTVRIAAMWTGGAAGARPCGLSQPGTRETT